MFNRDFDKIFHLDFDGNAAYCLIYDEHERTAFGTVGCSPAISPPEINYKALTAEGIILVPPHQMALYLDMSGKDEWTQDMTGDLRTAVDGEIISFEWSVRDNRFDLKYRGEMMGFGFFWFDIDICSDEICGRRAATYESIRY